MIEYRKFMERELFTSVGLRDTREDMFSVWCVVCAKMPAHISGLNCVKGGFVE